MARTSHLQIVLKVSERCNIKCTYCYFFFGGDQSYKNHAAVIEDDSIEAVARFLEREIASEGIDRVSIALHGGEPLLMKKQRFARMLERLTRATASTKLTVSLQTNGMLIDDEWVDIFTQYQIQVGVSLDGPRRMNDVYRIDKRNAGTYDRSVEGLKRVQNASMAGWLPDPAILCVINVRNDPKAIFEHFVGELGVKKLDFLLPDENHEVFDRNTIGEYGKFLSTAFHLWVKENDPSISIRIFEHLVFLLKSNRAGRRKNKEAQRSVKVITVSSDATIGLDDVLRSAVPSLFFQMKHVDETSLSELFAGRESAIVEMASEQLPDSCRGCLWDDVCAGGYHLVHRYSQEREFNNASVYCEDMKIILADILRALHRSGAPAERLVEALA